MMQQGGKTMNDAYVRDVKAGYYQDGKLKLPFIDGYPQEVAKSLTLATPAMSTKQARSFFDTINKTYTAVTLKNKTFDDAVIDLKMLKSRVSDKLGKGTVSEDFNSFIVLNADAVKSFADLKAFTLHFEAVCNYLRNDKSKPKQQNGNDNRDRHDNKNNYNKQYNNQKFRNH